LEIFTLPLLKFIHRLELGVITHVLPKGAVAQIVLCHPELDSGSHNLLILFLACRRQRC
jgi:hypothetical protein